MITKTVKEACEYIARHFKKEDFGEIEPDKLCESCEACFASEKAAVGINIKGYATFANCGIHPAVATINRDGSCSIKLR